jgi:hypothetical protein
MNQLRVIEKKAAEYKSASTVIGREGTGLHRTYPGGLLKGIRGDEYNAWGVNTPGMKQMSYLRGC